MHAVGGDGDLDGTVCLFVEVGAFGLVVLVVFASISEGQLTGSEDLETIVEIRSGSEVLSAEAGAGIVDFEQKNGLAGVIADSRQHMGRMASGDGEQAGEERKNAKGTHELKGNR